MAALHDLICGAKAFVIINLNTEEVICCKVKQTSEFKGSVIPPFYKISLRLSASNVVWQLRKRKAVELMNILNQNWYPGWQIISTENAHKFGITL